MKISSRHAWAIVTYIGIDLQAVYGIVAGGYADEGDYPFAIVILKVTHCKREHKVICGGVLVTREHVFTGCHCVGSWAETSESSTVVWEPNQTAYDINFSTPSATTSASSATHLLHRRQGSSTSDGSTSTTSGDMSTTSGDISPTSGDISTTSDDMSTNSSAGYGDNATTTGVTTTVLSTTNSSTTNDSSTVPGNTTMPATKGETFKPFVLGTVYMVAGTVWIYKFSRGQLRRAGNSFKHPRCNAKTVPWDYDFGIFRANAPFLLDEKRLYPMKIYHQDNEIFRRKFQSLIEGGKTCETIGWGATQLVDGSENPYDHTYNRTGVNMSEKLKHTYVKLVTDELCNELLCFPPYNFCNGSDFQWSEVGIVCAIHVNRGDSCDIDDGNALICEGHVFGFANTGLDCWANVPRFYTRLDYALDFYYSSVNLGTPSYLISLLTTVTAVVAFTFIKNSI